MTQTISIKDTRNKLADIVNQVSVGEDIFVITKFGKPKAMIIPISKKNLLNTSGIEESFGTWRNRNDIKDSNKWVETLRGRMSIRE